MQEDSPRCTMNIVNAGYDLTNYYLLEIRGGMLLVDCGWPGTLPKFLAEFKRKGIQPADIRFILVTHFHPDHAGLVQEIKDLGAELILMESQPDFIQPMVEMLKRKGTPYIEIRPQGNLLLRFEESRKFLAGLRLSGDILATPGHSEDSVTLVLDEGFAFTGTCRRVFMLAGGGCDLAGQLGPDLRARDHPDLCGARRLAGKHMTDYKIEISSPRNMSRPCERSWPRQAPGGSAATITAWPTAWCTVLATAAKAPIRIEGDGGQAQRRRRS